MAIDAATSLALTPKKFYMSIRKEEKAERLQTLSTVRVGYSNIR